MTQHLILWHRWLPSRTDEPERHEDIASWQRTVAARMTVTGGELLAQLSGTVVASLDPEELPDALDSALALLSEAESRGISCSIAATLGELTEVNGSWIGEALGRAQVLANRARATDLVLGPAVRDAAQGEFLFGRQINAGAGMPRGTTIDRENPRRADTASAIAKLAAPRFPPLGDPLLDELEAALTDRSSRTVVLRGPVGAGARELVATLAQRLAPGRVFQIGASPGGLVPLASLRLALLRRYGTIEGSREALGPTMGRIAAGDLVPRAELVSDLQTHLAAGPEGRSWVVLTPASLIDGATLAALVEARARGADFVIIGRLAVEADLPRPLAELDEPVLERTVPALKTSDAREVAQSVLGAATDEDVSRRVGVLGGDTVMGVVEAARTLIATGELVLGADGFEWRARPREGAVSINTVALLSERLELLDSDARRLLEGLCVMPDGENRALLESVAEKDGMAGRTFEAALRRLFRDAMVKDPDRPRPATSLLRWRVRTLIPPARVMELHRFVGEALLERGRDDTWEDAVLGYYLVKGGNEEAGAARLFAALEAVVAAGYERAARQISGWLDQATHEETEHVTPRTPPPPPLEPHEEGPPSSELPLDDLLSQSSAPRSADEASIQSVAPEELELDEEDLVLLEDTTQLPLASASIDAELDALIATRPSIIPSDPEGELDELISEEILLPEARLAATPDADPMTQSALDLELDELVSSKFEPRGTSAFAVEPGELELDEEDPLPPERTSVAPAPMSPFVLEAARALRDRDFGELEKIIDQALADGVDPGAAERVRAVAALARGDVTAANRSLEQTLGSNGRRASADARTMLVKALVSLHGGEPVDAVRAGLAALARSRRRADARGEAAALHTLAACYRALGRERDAARLEALRGVDGSPT